jgi:hypothetical protein
MFPGFATFEVMDKEPPVWLFFLYTISIGATGMLLARRRPIFCVPFITCVLLGTFALYLELRDSYVGHAIFREGGSAYILAAGLATFVGIVCLCWVLSSEQRMLKEALGLGGGR